MALLVCFHEVGAALDWSNKAICLDQFFYELVFNYLKGHEGDSPLKKMVMLGYDDELVVPESQIVELLKDLEQVIAEGKIRHPQIPLFYDIVREASSSRRELLIGGDMYPDLSQGR